MFDALSLTQLTMVQPNLTRSSMAPSKNFTKLSDVSLTSSRSNLKWEGEWEGDGERGNSTPVEEGPLAWLGQLNQDTQAFKPLVVLPAVYCQVDWLACQQLVHNGHGLAIKMLNPVSQDLPGRHMEVAA